MLMSAMHAPNSAASLIKLFAYFRKNKLERLSEIVKASRLQSFR